MHLSIRRLVGLVLLCAGSAACRAPTPAPSVSAADCADLSSDEELGALYRRPVRQVEPIHRYRAALDHHELQGAAIKLSTAANEDVLERALRCHAARHDVAAMAAPDARIDPLRPAKGRAAVSVERRGDDVIVNVTAADEAVARDILERARSLQNAAPAGG